MADFKKTSYGYSAEVNDFDEAMAALKIRAAAKKIAQKKIDDPFLDNDHALAEHELRLQGPQRFIITGQVGVDEFQIAAHKIGIDTVWHDECGEIALVTDDEGKIQTFKTMMKDYWWELFDRSNGVFEEGPVR